MDKRFKDKDDAEDRRIKAEARTRAKKYPKDFSKSVRGIRCRFCGSRKTKTEFYRIPPTKSHQKAVPMFGATACDDCGAC